MSQHTDSPKILKTGNKTSVMEEAVNFLSASPGLQEFAPDIWTVEGPVVRDMGLDFTTRMTIVKLSNGSLWVDSPVPVSFEVIKQVNALGALGYLIAATPRHVWRLEVWHGLFPDAQLWTAKPTPITLDKAHLTYTGSLGNKPPEDWAADLDQVVFKGNPLNSEVVFYHPKSRTVILDDLIQIHQSVRGKPLLNSFLKMEGVLSPYGGVGLDIRLTYFNRKLARQSLEKILSWDFDKLIIAHGPCISTGARPFVERAFEWITR